MGAIGGKRNIIFLYVLSVLCMAVMYFYYVSPAEGKRDQIENDLLLVKSNFNDLQTKDAAKVAGKLGSKQLVELAQLRTRIPEQANTDSLLRDLRMLETVTKLQMTSYSLDSPAIAASHTPIEGDKVAKALYAPIHLETTVKGNYQQIYRLMEEIQTMPRLMTIDKLTLTAPTSAKVKLGEPNREMICTLTLTAYYAPELQAYLTASPAIEFAKPAGHSNPFN